MNADALPLGGDLATSPETPPLSPRDEALRLLYATASDGGKWPLFLETLEQALPQTTCLLLLSAQGLGERKLVLPQRKGGGVIDIEALFDPKRTHLFFQPLPLPSNLAALLLGAKEVKRASPLQSGLIVACQLDNAQNVDTAFIRGLKPHFEQVAEISQRLSELRNHREILADVLDHFPIGVLVVDANGKALAANKRGREIKGPLTFAADGKAASERREVTKRFREALGQVINAEGKPKRVVLEIGREEAAPQRLLICPMTPLDNAASGSALVLVDDGLSPARNLANAMQEMYGLTPSEIRIVQGLIQGKRLDEIAAAAKASISTVRNQLKSVFQKTNTGRQADLINLILSGPAPFIGD